MKSRKRRKVGIVGKEGKLEKVGKIGKVEKVVRIGKVRYSRLGAVIKFPMN